MKNQYGSDIYIVPLDETSSGVIKYLGVDIIIDRDKDYRYKQFEVTQ